MRIASVGIVGYGNFGAFAHVLLKRFAPKVAVRVYSSRFKPDGKTFFSLEEVAQSDAVVIAAPISAYEETLKKVVPLTKKDAVLVDVATVKIHTTQLLRRLAEGRPYIATHPMFGPESYAKSNKDVSGFRIVVTGSTLPKNEYRTLIAWVKKLGFSVIELTPTQHDKHLAETLFLTHFIGQTVTEAGFDRTEIDTVSFGFLMDAVETVRADKKLFEDVFRFNPHCKTILERLKVAEDKVRRTLKS